MKNLMILLSIIACAFMLNIAHKKQALNNKRELITELSPLECDLNISECLVTYKGKEVIFSIEPRPLKVLEESKIKIKNLDFYPKLNAKLYGLNMYMGDIVSEFNYKNNEYESEIVFSTCSENTMRYRFELFDDEKSLNLFIDFDVRR